MQEKKNLADLNELSASQWKRDCQDLVSSEDPEQMRRCVQFYSRELERYCLESELTTAKSTSISHLISSFRDDMVDTFDFI